MKKRIFALLLVLVLALSLLPTPIVAEGDNTLTVRYVQEEQGKYSVDDSPNALEMLTLGNQGGYRLAFYYNGVLVENSTLSVSDEACLSLEDLDGHDTYVRLHTLNFGGAQILYTPEGSNTPTASLDVDVCVGFSDSKDTPRAISEWAYDGTDDTKTIYLLAGSGYSFTAATKADSDGNSALFTLQAANDSKTLSGNINDNSVNTSCLKLTLNDSLLSGYSDHCIGVDVRFGNGNLSNRETFWIDIEEVQSAASHLAVRYLSWDNDGEKFVEDTGRNLLDSISGVKGYRDSLIFYYITNDGQSAIQVDDLRVSGPLSLEHENDGHTNNSRYARLCYTGFGNGEVSYTPQDGQPVSLPVSVSLPTFGFYTGNARSEENYTTEWKLREQSTLYIFLEKDWKFASDQDNAGLSIRGDTPDGITLTESQDHRSATISVNPDKIDALQNSNTHHIELHYEISDEHGGQGSDIQLELNYDKSIPWQNEPTAESSISYEKNYTLTEEIAGREPDSLDSQLYRSGSDESVGAFEFDSDSDGTPETYYVSLGRYFTRPDGEVYLELCQNSGTTISEEEVRRGEYAAGVFTAIEEDGPDGPQRTYTEASPEIYQALADSGYHFTVTLYRTDRCANRAFPKFSEETSIDPSGRPCPFSLRFGAENTGYWIMAARLLDSQGAQVAMGHGSEQIFVTKDVVYNLTSEIDTMDELNNFIADSLAQQDHARVFFNLPQGIAYEGILRIPFTYGLNDCTPIISGHDTTITGGVIVGNEGDDADDTRYLAERCSFYAVDFDNIRFIGAGKDSDTPNNYGISGPGRATYSNCSFTGYDHAIHNDLNFTFGGQNSTFENNNVGIYLDCRLDNGGNWEILNCTFKHNVSAMELIRFPGGSLNPVSVQNTKFLNNGIDVNNRTGRFLDFSFNYFYHGPENAEMNNDNYPDHSKRLIPIFYGLWQNSADIPATLAWPLATTPACDTFFCPGYQTMQKAYNGKLNGNDNTDVSQVFFDAFTKGGSYNKDKDLFGKRDTAWVSMGTASKDACRISANELEGQIISYVDENNGIVGILSFGQTTNLEFNARFFAAGPMRAVRSVSSTAPLTAEGPVLAAAPLLAAAQDDSFDPSFTKTALDGQVTLSFPEENNYRDHDISFSLPWSLSAANRAVEVLHNGSVVLSLLEDGMVSFSLSEGGSYTVREYTPIDPVKPSNPSKPSTPSTPSTPVNNVSDTVKVEASVSNGTATVKDIPASEISKAGTDAVTLDFSETGKTVNEVKLPADTMETIAASSSEGLEIKLSTAAVSFDAAAVDAISDAATGKDISLNVETVDVKALSAEQKSTIEGLGNAIIIQATLTSGGETISDFGGGSAAVTVPYEKKNADKVVAVYYMDDAGKLTKMNASYDAKTKSITFTAPHFSEYVLTEIDALPFTDVAESDWYCDSVRYVFEQGLMGGTSAATFAPSALTNRQQVWMILARLSGEKPADMAAARAWAIKTGVSDGSKPTASITRQQLAAMLYRYAGSPAASGTLGFTDKASIADYAKDAVLWCVEKGIIGGYTDGSVRPAANASRAHLAAMLQRYMELVG